LVTIDMSAAFIQDVADHLPNARVTFDKVARMIRRHIAGRLEFTRLNPHAA
jgi:transposase